MRLFCLILVIFTMSFCLPCIAAPKIGVSAGGCKITGSAPKDWRQRLQNSIANKIEMQPSYKTLVQKLGKQQIVCQMTLKAVLGDQLEASEVKILNGSLSEELDQKFLELLKNTSPYENIPSIWKLVVSVRFEEHPQVQFL